MTPEEHAVAIRECSELILRHLAAQKFEEIIPLLDAINGHTYDIQTGK